MDINNIEAAPPLLALHKLICLRINRVNKVTRLEMVNNVSTFDLSSALKDVVEDKQMNVIVFNFKTEVMSLLAKRKEEVEAAIKEL